MFQRMGNNNSPVMTNLVTLGLMLAFIGSAWLLVDVGIQESFDVITDDTGNISASTVTTFGGDVGFADRIVTIGAWLTLLTGIGAVATSGNNPKAFNNIIRFYPLIIGLIGFMEFSTVVSEMAGGSYDFDAYSDGENALALFVTGSVVSGIAGTLGMKNRF
jgi:hypothetical protein